MQKIKIILCMLIFGCMISYMPIQADVIQTCTDETQAENLIKDALLKHSSQLQFYYDYDKCSRSLYVKLIKDACKQENIGREGDYLYRLLSGYSTDVSSRANNQGLITYQFNYLTTIDQESVVDARVNQILAGLDLNGKDDYTKIKKIYEYVTKHVKYDTTYTKFTAYSAITNGQSVCQGYAHLLHRLLIDAGLSSRIIPGSVDGKHMWNIVKLKDKWYNLDATADSGNSKLSHFLVCNDELPDYTREYEYTTNEFNKECPMSKTCYKRECINNLKYVDKKINNLKYKGLDDTIINVGKNKHKLQIIFYYPLKNELSMQELAELKKAALTKKKGLKILAVEVGRANRLQVKRLERKYGNADFVCAYDNTYNTYNALCSNYYQVTKTKKAAYPIVMILDNKNKVRYIKMGSGVTDYVKKAVEKLYSK